MIRTLMLATTLFAAAPAFAQMPANPFAVASPLPYQAPPFDRIKDSDYHPAMEQGMAEQLAETRAIAGNPAAPTFDNTVAALERSGRMLDRVQQAFGGLVQAKTNATLQKAQAVEAPKLAAHQDAIYLDPKLFARFKMLHDERASLNLTAEQAMLLETDYQQFIHAGAQLSPADQTKLRALNAELSTLETGFQQKLLAAAKAGARLRS